MQQSWDFWISPCRSSVKLKTGTGLGWIHSNKFNWLEKAMSYCFFLHLSFGNKFILQRENPDLSGRWLAKESPISLSVCGSHFVSFYSCHMQQSLDFWISMCRSSVKLKTGIGLGWMQSNKFNWLGKTMSYCFFTSYNELQRGDKHSVIIWSHS